MRGFTEEEMEILKELDPEEREALIKERTQQEADELGRKLSDFVNTFNDAEVAEALGRAVRNQHRTLQQNTMRFVISLLQGWARDLEENRYDARNEATVRLAKKLLEGHDRYDLLLPTI